MKNKLIFAILISVFLIGMILSPVSASHTYKKGGYKFTVSNHQYKQIQYVKKHRWSEYLKTSPNFKVKTNKYKKVKVKYTYYKKKKYFKYYQLYKNGKSLGDYCRSNTKMSKRTMNIVKQDVGGRITQRSVYGYKKVKKYGTRYTKKRVYAEVETYDDINTGYRPIVTFRALPDTKSLGQYYL